MQRWFSTFPGDSPGFGLLLLRITLGITTLFKGVEYLSETNRLIFLNWIIGLFAIFVGMFLLVGFLTPIISVIVFAGNIVLISLSLINNQFILLPSEIYAIVLAIAIILLGPGAFSLDARLFGRREIIIPKKE